MTNPGARSLGTFMVADRDDTDRLIAGLLDQGIDPVAAGDLLADGVPVRVDTRRRVVDALVADVESPEPWRVLHELGVEADVANRLAELATEEKTDDRTRLLVARVVIEVDEARGARLLREVAGQVTDPAASRMVGQMLDAYGAGSVEGWAAEALLDRSADPFIDDRERVAAAVRLAGDGDPSALLGLLEAPGIKDDERLRAAVALADRGDDSALLALTGEVPPADYYIPRSGTYLPYRALQILHRRDHPRVATMLGTFVERVGGPSTYGAAVMLSERGDFGGLIGLTAPSDEPPELAESAARYLALHGDPASVARAASTARPEARLWLTAGRPARENIEWYLVRARAGDAGARQHLRRTAARGLSLRARRRAVSALAALGDAGGLDLLRRRARRGRPVTRLHAAVTLGRWNPAERWHSLRELAVSARPRLRVRAAARLANETGELGPLAGLVADSGMPARYRGRAAGILENIAGLQALR
jgi:HEAT repeat protein